MKLSSLHNFIFLPMVLCAVNLYATDDYLKEIKKSVRVNSNVNISLDVNFADVSIVTWDQPQADILVRINAGAKTQERADEIFKNIEVNITEGVSEVRIEVRLANTNCKNNENLEIDVDIKMPATGSISGEANFGDVTLDYLKGACRLHVQYGSFDVKELSANTNDVKVSFGGIEIQKFGGGDLKTEYSETDIEKIGGNSAITSDFGNIEVAMVDAECKNLTVNVEYGNADIHLAPGSSYSFDAKAEYGHVDLPDSASKSQSDKDYTSEHFTGKIGNGNGGTLHLRSSFGNVEISQ